MKEKNSQEKGLLYGLQKSGLGDKEAALYLAALSLGPVGMSDLSKSAGLKRPTAYLAFRSLAEKGLMTCFKNTSGFKFAASRPETLLAKAKRNVESLNDLVPQLDAVAEKENNKPRTFYYEGKEGYFIAMNDSLKNNPDKLLRHIGSISEIHRVVTPEYDYAHYLPQRVKSEIFLRALYFENEIATELMKRKHNAEMREIRLLPKKYFHKTSMLIYANRVAFFSSEKELMAVIIESDAIAASEKKKFDLLWDYAPTKTLS